MPPTVSVVMTVYNGEKYLRAAIDSVLAQTFDDWELIVVDDASSDSTPDILKLYGDPRIKCLRNEQNRRQAVCSNLAISIATGRYIARLDADDVSLPDRLEKQVSYMNAHPDTSLVGSAAFEINEQGERIGLRPGGLSNCTLTLALFNPIVHSSVMYRTDMVRELSGYNEEERFWFSEDYEFLSRIALCGKAILLSEPLIEYRVHSNSVTSVHVDEQSRQAACLARISMERILSHKVDDPTWSAWLRFTKTHPGHAVSFDAAEVNSLRLLVIGLIQGVHHDRGGRCKHPLLWARHALALALFRRGVMTLHARISLAFMALHIWIDALVAHR